MDKNILNQFRLTVNERGLGVYGIVLYKEGEGIVSHRWRSDDRECLYSGSKTFAAIGVGIAADEGLLKITDKVLDYFPEFKANASPKTETITIKDLLHMASGKPFMYFGRENPDERADDTIDYADQFFRYPVETRPGIDFFYSNACTYMLGRTVEKITGLTMRDYLMPRLFDVLNIYNPQWMTCPKGHTLCGTGLYLTTEEFSRLGKLLLQEGEYDGKRVVSAGYVRAMGTDIVDCSSFSADAESASGYGYQVWRCTRKELTFRADGKYGQFSVVMPDLRAVATITAHRYPAANDILRAVWSDIVPQL